jgi:hypothetical protein
MLLPIFENCNTAGMVPAIYEKGTLFVTNQRLTLQMLKEKLDVGIKYYPGHRFKIGYILLFLV